MAAPQLTASRAEPGGHPHARRYFWILMALALIVALPGLFMGLHADDWFHVRPRSAGETLAAFAGDWNQGRRGEGGFYRPMVRLSFSLGTWLHGFNAPAHHALNGLLFLIIVAASWAGARLLAPESPRWALVVIATLLVLNPVKNEALYWVSGRTDLMATAFVAWSVVAALWAVAHRHSLAVVAAIALLLAGLLSKEIALAASAAIPLMVWLLVPREQRHWHGTYCLLIAMPLMGLLWLLWRSWLLGGLAGYTREPASVAVYITAWLRPLSAIAVPWQSDGPDHLRPWLAVIGGGVAAVVLVARGVPRGAVAMLAVLLLAALPLAFVTIEPNDGLRNLMLPLFFAVLFLVGLFPRASFLELPAIGGLLLLAVSLQPANLRITDQFLAARGPNAAAVQAAWLAATSAPDGAVLIAPEPPRTGQRRILDPGAALMMAVEAHWMAQEESASQDIVDEAAPRFALALSTPAKSIVLAHALQPWMAAPIVHLAHDSTGELVALELTPASAEQFFRTDDPEANLTLAVEESNTIVVFASVVEGRATPAITLVRDGEQVDTRHGHYFYEIGPGIGWMDTLPWRRETPPWQAVYHAGEAGGGLRLRQASARAYVFTTTNPAGATP